MLVSEKAGFGVILCTEKKKTQNTKQKEKIEVLLVVVIFG